MTLRVITTGRKLGSARLLVDGTLGRPKQSEWWASESQPGATSAPVVPWSRSLVVRERVPNLPTLDCGLWTVDSAP
jgi:hypothetical protein